MQLELLRKFSHHLNTRRVRQMAQQEEQQQTPQPQQRASPPPSHQQHQQAFQEEVAFIKEVLPAPAEQLEALQQALQQSATGAQIQPLQQQMEAVATELPLPVNIETPELQRLIEQLVLDQQQTAGVAEAVERMETDRLRERFQQTVEGFRTALQRQLQQQPPEAAWQQHTEAFLVSGASTEGLQEASALMQLLAGAVDRRQLTPEQTSGLARQLDLAAELRTEMDREELRPPDVKNPDRLAEQMAATAATLHEAQQQLAAATPPSAAQKAEVQILQAQQALQQAAQRAQQAAAQFSGGGGGGGQAVQQAVADLAAATSAAEARQAAETFQRTLEQGVSDQAAAQQAKPSVQQLRQAATDLLQKQLRAQVVKSQTRMRLLEVVWMRPQIFFAIDIQRGTAPLTPRPAATQPAGAPRSGTP